MGICSPCPSVAAEQCDVADRSDDWVIEFKPGWPDAVPIGLIVVRSLLRPRMETDAQPDEDRDQVLRFTIHGVRHPGSPKFGLMGDLTITNDVAFAGITVLMPLLTRDEPDDDLTNEETDQLVLQYGEWATALLYDHAAHAMRSLLSSGAFDIDVPYDTPKPEIHTHASEDSSTEIDPTPEEDTQDQE